MAPTPGLLVPGTRAGAAFKGSSDPTPGPLYAHLQGPAGPQASARPGSIVAYGTGACSESVAGQLRAGAQRAAGGAGGSLAACRGTPSPGRDGKQAGIGRVTGDAGLTAARLGGRRRPGTSWAEIRLRRPCERPRQKLPQFPSPALRE